MGGTAAFMLTEPATKITNLGALKIALSFQRFLPDIFGVMGFALLAGFLSGLLF